MKRTACKLLLSVFVTFAQLFAPSLTGRAGGESLHAQDAFYIYRNDGDFNGFFYDQVVRMGYSKFDLDSVEHDVYVVQDVETVDSLYRIPLAAIDSIGFQQPEIILNPRMKNLEQIGLHEYIITMTKRFVDVGGVSKEQIQITLNKNLPASLLPKVGDVLVDWDEEYCMKRSYGKSGFAGKVTEVRLVDNDFFVVNMEKLSDLSDVFIQFISTEMITVDEQGKARHRLAGWNSNGKRKAYEGEDELTFVNVDGTFKRTFSPKDGVEIGLEAEVELLSKMRVTYNIRLNRLFVKTEMTNHAMAKLAASLQASTSFDGYIDVMEFLGKIKFPVNLPIFQTRPLPRIDVKASGSLGLKLTFPKAEFDWNPTVIFDTKADKIMRFTQKEKKQEEGGEESPIDIGDLELKLNGSLQAGIEFSANIETNDWIEDIFSSGIALSLMVGPKLEGGFNLSAAGLARSGAYGMMKDSSVKFHPLSADLSASAEMKFLWNDREKTTFYEKSRQWGTMEWFLFPVFSNLKATFNPMTRQIESSVVAKRKTFIPSTIGIRLVDYKYDPVASQDYFKPYFLANDSVKVEANFDAKSLKAGRYYIYPTLKVGGNEVQGTSNNKFMIDVPPYVIHNTPGIDSIEVSGERQTVREYIKTNTEELSTEIIDPTWRYFTTSTSSRKDWITPTFSDIDLKEENAYLNLDIAANENVFSRYDDIRLGGMRFPYTDTIRVKQKPKYNEIKYYWCSLTFDSGSDKWMDKVEKCSRNGDVITISGTSKVGSSTRIYHITIDNTDIMAPHVVGEITMNYYDGVTEHYQFDCALSRPMTRPGKNGNWRNYDDVNGVEELDISTVSPNQVSKLSGTRTMNNQTYNLEDFGIQFAY